MHVFSDAWIEIQSVFESDGETESSTKLIQFGCGTTGTSLCLVKLFSHLHIWNVWVYKKTVLPPPVRDTELPNSLKGSDCSPSRLLP